MEVIAQAALLILIAFFCFLVALLITILALVALSNINLNPSRSVQPAAPAVPPPLPTEIPKSQIAFRQGDYCYRYEISLKKISEQILTPDS